MESNLNKAIHKIALIWSVLVNCLSIFILVSRTNNVFLVLAIIQVICIFINVYFSLFSKKSKFCSQSIFLRYICLFFLPLNFILTVMPTLVSVIGVFGVYLIVIAPVIIGYNKIKTSEKLRTLATIHYFVLTVFTTFIYIAFSFLAGAGA